MSNSTYSQCMTSAMRDMPKGISREERGNLFCVNAKLCSGKARNKADAEQQCANRTPTEHKSGGSRRGIDSGEIAKCALPRLAEYKSITVQQLATIISECSGKHGDKKIKKPEGKNHFIKVCAMEGVVNGSFAESIKLRKACELKWKEKQASEAGNAISAG